MAGANQFEREHRQNAPIDNSGVANLTGSSDLLTEHDTTVNNSPDVDWDTFFHSSEDYFLPNAGLQYVEDPECGFQASYIASTVGAGHAMGQISAYDTTEMTNHDLSTLLSMNSAGFNTPSVIADAKCLRGELRSLENFPSLATDIDSDASLQYMSTEVFPSQSQCFNGTATSILRPHLDFGDLELASGKPEEEVFPGDSPFLPRNMQSIDPREMASYPAARENESMLFNIDSMSAMGTQNAVAMASKLQVASPNRRILKSLLPTKRRGSAISNDYTPSSPRKRNPCGPNSTAVSHRTVDVVSALETAFVLVPKPCGDDVRKISELTGLSLEDVYRRYRERELHEVLPRDQFKAHMETQDSAYGTLSGSLGTINSGGSSEYTMGYTTTARRSQIFRPPEVVHPYQCTWQHPNGEFCGARLRNAYEGGRHELTHYPGRFACLCLEVDDGYLPANLICPECDEPCNEVQNLKRHIHNSHWTQLNLARTFARKQGLIEHVRKHHPQIRLPEDLIAAGWLRPGDVAFDPTCGYCGETMSCWDFRIRHIYNEHYKKEPAIDVTSWVYGIQQQRKDSLNTQATESPSPNKDNNKNIACLKDQKAGDEDSDDEDSDDEDSDDEDSDDENSDDEDSDYNTNDGHSQGPKDESLGDNEDNDNNNSGHKCGGDPSPSFPLGDAACDGGYETSQHEGDHHPPNNIGQHQLCNDPALVNIETDLSNLHITLTHQRILGRGAFASVDEVLVESSVWNTDPIIFTCPSRLTEELAKGGWAVARKTLRFTQGERDKRLQEVWREVENLRRFQHLHVVQLIGASIQKASLMILTLPVADCNLGDFMKCQKPPISPEVAAQMELGLSCLTSAVDHVHALGGWHQDIKPANILIFGGRRVWILSDFGTSHFADEERRRNDTRFTPLYAAPELFSDGTVGTAVDIWSLGCIFVEVISWLTGAETSMEDLSSFLFQDVPVPQRSYHSKRSEIEVWLELLSTRYSPKAVYVKSIRQMLEREPDKRPTAVDLCRRFPQHSYCCPGQLPRPQDRPCLIGITPALPSKIGKSSFVDMSDRKKIFPLLDSYAIKRAGARRTRDISSCMMCWISKVKCFQAPTELNCRQCRTHIQHNSLLRDSIRALPKITYPENGQVSYATIADSYRAPLLSAQDQNGSYELFIESSTGKINHQILLDPAFATDPMFPDAALQLDDIIQACFKTPISGNSVTSSAIKNALLFRGYLQLFLSVIQSQKKKRNTDNISPQTAELTRLMYSHFQLLIIDRLENLSTVLYRHFNLGASFDDAQDIEAYAARGILYLELSHFYWEVTRENPLLAPGTLISQVQEWSKALKQVLREDLSQHCGMKTSSWRSVFPGPWKSLHQRRGFVKLSLQQSTSKEIDTASPSMTSLGSLVMKGGDETTHNAPISIIDEPSSVAI